MRRVVFLVAVIVLAVGMMQASDMRFGVKAGLSMGNVNKDVEDFGAPPEADKKMRMGLTFGAMMHMPLGEKMTLMVEGAYVQKGFTIEYMGDDMTLKFDYLQADVLAGYHFSDSFGVYAGPGLGFIMAAEEENPYDSYDIKDYVESTEFSLNFGVQFMATENICLDARYNMGMSSLFKEDDEIDLRSRTISLTVGYLF